MEWAEVHISMEHLMHQITDIWEKSRVVIMDVDVQGAHTFMQTYPKESYTIFIKPPNLDALRERVQKRDGNSITPDDLDVRMEKY
ncbi:MAG: hypothetical protein R2827_08680 [Bdellovibrionales bacterium]